MNEYLLIIIYIIGVLYAAFAYGAVVGEIEITIIAIFFWPIILIIFPLIGIITPFYLMGRGCMECIRNCDKRRESKRALLLESQEYDKGDISVVKSSYKPVLQIDTRDNYRRKPCSKDEEEGQDNEDSDSDDYEEIAGGGYRL